MCGRFASFRDAQELADAFDIDPDAVAAEAAAVAASWNVAPTDPVRVVVQRRPRHSPGPSRRSLQVARWGLVPSWAKERSIGPRMINARSETLADKPAFRAALRARRCLVPAEGWYEWHRPDRSARGRAGTKQAYWIRPDDPSPLALAGLFETWRDPARADDDPERWLVTTTVVTADATEDPVLGPVHARRPVALPAQVWDRWLDPDLQDPREALAVLGTPGPACRPVQVSPAVGSVANDGPGLVEPLEAT